MVGLNGRRRPLSVYGVKDMLRKAIVFSMVTTLAAGCATTREAEFDEAKPAEAAEGAVDEASSLVSEGDALWNERADKEKLMAALVKWEEAAKKAPTAELYVKLSRGHYFLGDAFYGVEGNVEKRDEHYTIGLGFAEKAMALAAPDYVAAVKAGESHESAIKKAELEAVPAMYWYATNIGKWANAKGFVTVLKYKDDIKATMLRVMELNPDYFYAAPLRYFGAYEAKTAGLAGGSLEKSKDFFEQAVKNGPDYLGTKVLYAEYYATKTQDKDLYEKLLKEVLAADPKVDAAIEPENVREQMKAKLMLDNIDDNF